MQHNAFDMDDFKLDDVQTILSFDQMTENDSIDFSYLTRYI
jgi:hypothetical protein